MAELESVLAGSTRANRALNGVLFLGGLELTYNVYGGTNSSPQTTEVFGGGERSASLMKWVSIAGVKCIVYAVLASFIARSWWPSVGVGVGATAMHGLYVHANRCALAREAAGGSTGMPSPASSPARYRARGPLAAGVVPPRFSQRPWR